MPSMKDLPADDEFHGIECRRMSVEMEGQPAREVAVQPATYTLLSWWRELGDEDAIKISPDAGGAQLAVDVELNLDDSDIDNTGSIYIEADEGPYAITFFCYPSAMRELDHDEFSGLQRHLMYANAQCKFGSFEGFTVDGEEFHVRFKASAYLRGVLKGKVAVVSTLVERSQAEVIIGMNRIRELTLSTD